MKRKQLLALLMGVFLPLLSIAAEDETPIVVQLETETQLMPLYLAPVADDQSGFSTAYLNALENVMRFDLDHNGMTTVVKSTPSLEKLNRSMDHDFKGDLSPWGAQNVYFAIKTKIKDKQLSARIYIVNGNNIKSVDGVSLTGNLAEDRRTIHALSDKIHKTLFNTDGIAMTRVLYTVKTQSPQTKKWTSEICEADYDGANARQLTKSGDYCVSPAFIPPKSGSRAGSFVFVSYKGGQPKIFLGNMQDSTLQRFSLLKGNQLMPTISRQRTAIAFISDVTGNPDLFIQDFDPDKGALGKPRQIFSTYKATQASPTFSPDGKKIAFVSNKDGSPRIYVIDVPAEGTSLKDIKATLISKMNRENTAPCWSPDGSKIAYCAKTKDTRQIWVYDFDTRRERQITQGPGNKENPSWAPNSLHIVFNSTDPGASELYLINLNQKEATRISKGPGEKHFPAWESSSLF